MMVDDVYLFVFLCLLGYRYHQHQDTQNKIKNHNWASPLRAFFVCILSSRPVKDAVQAWEMKPMMWVFEGSKGLDADTEMLISLRNEMGETLKWIDKVLPMGSSGGSHDFNKVLSKLRHLYPGMKAGARTWYSLVVYEYKIGQDMSYNTNTTDTDTTR